MIESNPEAALRFKEMIINYETMVIQEDTKRLDIVNQTMRTEYETTGKFKTCWRPYWGWVSGTVFGVQMLSFIYIGLRAVVKSPKEAIGIINALAALAGALAPIWFFALSILGVAVYKRSQDKQIAAGMQPMGILKTVLSKILK